ncbi:MAG: sugar phosphate isomerase/epimerase [Spirochaetes bacterium]|nr:sugar phosphate isomerase/epimerase [Spirochaetota bacterium]
MKFAVFSVSLPEWSPEEALKKLKALGYDGVEWRVIDQKPSADGKPSFWAGNRCTWPVSSFVEDAPRIKAMTAQAGLEMPCLGTYASMDELENVERGMKGAAILGVKKLRVGTQGYDGKAPWLPLRDRAVAKYREVEAMAKRHGVRALIEMHMNTLTPSASSARAFAENFNPAHVGVIYDLGNVVYEGYEHYRLALEALGPYLAHVHVKNAVWKPTHDEATGVTQWKTEAAPLKKGVADFKRFFETLKDIGYDDWVSVEDFSTEGALEDRVRENAGFLRSLVK